MEGKSILESVYFSGHAVKDCDEEFVGTSQLPFPVHVRVCQPVCVCVCSRAEEEVAATSLDTPINLCVYSTEATEEVSVIRSALWSH